MNNEDFIILDIETTGFSPLKDEIIEIAAIKVNAKTLEEIDHYTSLIKIKGDVPSFITTLTGITKIMIQQGKKLNIVLNELAFFCSNHMIYAHNSPFDQRFIRHYLQIYNVNFIKTNWIDTINIFKRKWPYRNTYKLASLIIDFGIAKKEVHRALSDARHTLLLLQKCL